MTIESLATAINEATGYTGKELMAATFFVSACYADLSGRKDVGDYFIGRMKAVTTEPKESK